MLLLLSDLVWLREFFGENILFASGVLLSAMSDHVCNSSCENMSS